MVLFALARLGAVLVPLNFRLAPAEWDKVLQDCTPGALCHDDTWADAAQALATRHGLACWPVTACLSPNASPPETADPWTPFSPALGDAPVLLVYTSGTTGQPKGAVHTQANLLANMQAAAQVQELQPSDHVLTVLPLFHVGGLCIQTLPALWAGASVCLLPRFEPTACLQAIAQERPSLTLVVPAVMKALIEHPQWASTALDSLRAVWAGSSSLPSDSVQAFLGRGIPLCNVYGATETGPFSIALPEQQAYSHVGDCGWPAPGVSATLAPPEAHASGSQAGVGEVWPRGPALAPHYATNHPARAAPGLSHGRHPGPRGPGRRWSMCG